MLRAFGLVALLAVMAPVAAAAQPPRDEAPQTRQRMARVLERSDGWYLAYNVRLGTYVHVECLGTHQG